MILPCEVAVKSVIPAIKAAMAKNLVENYGLKQNQAAKLLGISQSAVSKYITQTRGKMINVEEVEEAKNLINEMIQELIEKRQKRSELLDKFCKTCLIVRKAGLMCKFCHKTEPEITSDQCEFCLSQECNYSVNFKHGKMKI